MASIPSYRELTVWQKSFLLTKKVYNVTSQLPKSEIFGLISQMQRAAVSIPSNIAEGQQRRSAKEYRQFLGVAQGSSAELETQLMLIETIYKINVSEMLELVTEIQKMLYSLGQKLTRTYNL